MARNEGGRSAPQLLATHLGEEGREWEGSGFERVLHWTLSRSCGMQMLITWLLLSPCVIVWCRPRAPTWTMCRLCVSLIQFRGTKQDSPLYERELGCRPKIKWKILRTCNYHTRPVPHVTSTDEVVQAVACMQNNRFPAWLLQRHSATFDELPRAQYLQCQSGRRLTSSCHGSGSSFWDSVFIRWRQTVTCSFKRHFAV